MIKNRSNEMSRSQVGIKNKGFTLIEVLVSITILFLVIAAVFYFYYHSMDNQVKLKEKYRVMRISKEFIESFIFGNDWDLSVINQGQEEVEDFILQWNSYPIQDARDVILTSGVAPKAQLKRVHLRVIKKETGKSVLDLHFLVNTVIPPSE